MEFFTVEELAKLLKVSVRFILQLITDKKIRAYKVGRSWRIEKSDLDVYLENNKNFM